MPENRSVDSRVVPLTDGPEPFGSERVISKYWVEPFSKLVLNTGESGDFTGQELADLLYDAIASARNDRKAQRRPTNVVDVLVGPRLFLMLSYLTQKASELGELVNQRQVLDDHGTFMGHSVAPNPDVGVGQVWVVFPDRKPFEERPRGSEPAIVRSRHG